MGSRVGESQNQGIPLDNIDETQPGLMRNPQNPFPFPAGGWTRYLRSRPSSRHDLPAFLERGSETDLGSHSSSKPAFGCSIEWQPFAFESRARLWLHPLPPRSSWNRSAARHGRATLSPGGIEAGTNGRWKTCQAQGGRHFRRSPLHGGIDSDLRWSSHIVSFHLDLCCICFCLLRQLFVFAMPKRVFSDHRKKTHCRDWGGPIFYSCLKQRFKQTWSEGKT